jgi:hypothetical protein
LEKGIGMESNEKDAACDADPLKEVRAAEHELAEARELEKRAEAHLEKAVEGLEHNKPHEFQIIVNGRKKVWTEEKIGYEQLVVITNLPLPPGPNPGFTITYHEGPHDHPDGTLTAGHSVKVVDCMVFNVTPTNQS